MKYTSYDQLLSILSQTYCSHVLASITYFGLLFSRPWMTSVLLNLMVNSVLICLADSQLFMQLITFSLQYFPLLASSIQPSGFPPTSLVTASQYPLLTSSSFSSEVLNVKEIQSPVLGSLLHLHFFPWWSLIWSHGFTSINQTIFCNQEPPWALSGFCVENILLEVWFSRKKLEDWLWWYWSNCNSRGSEKSYSGFILKVEFRIYWWDSICTVRNKKVESDTNVFGLKLTKKRYCDVGNTWIGVGFVCVVGWWSGENIIEFTFEMSIKHPSVYFDYAIWAHETVYPLRSWAPQRQGLCMGDYWVWHSSWNIVSTQIF